MPIDSIGKSIADLVTEVVMIKILGMVVFGLIGIVFIVLGFIKWETTMIGMGFIVLGIPVMIKLSSTSTFLRKYLDTEESGALGLQVIGAALGGGPSTDEERLELLDTEAAYMFSTGDYKGAAKAGQQALKLAEQVSGPDHPEVARISSNLGTVYVALKQYSQAELLYQRAIAIREKVSGPDDLNIVECLNKLAEIDVNRGQYAHAESGYKRALAIVQKALGPDDPNIAKLLEHMAELYRKMDGRKVEAQVLTKMAARIRAAVH